MSEHARRSPSSIERWWACPRSVRALEGLIDTTSEYAAHGTCQHWIRATCLELGMDVIDFVGQAISCDGFHFIVEPEWVEWIQPGVDRIREMPGTLYVEQRVTLDHWLPGDFGTADTAIIDRDRSRIFCSDYKGGAGEPVSVVKNKQVMAYALGVWDNFTNLDSSIETFILEIDQPRAGGTSTWEVSTAELKSFGDELRERGRAVDAPDAKFVATQKGCRWCPLSDGRCDTHSEFNLNLMMLRFDDLEDWCFPGLPSQMTPERKAFVILHSEMFTRWLSALKAERLGEAMTGRPTPGLKAVEGRMGPRAWANAKEAETYLKSHLTEDVLYVKELISPTQAEKKLGTKGWKNAKHLISRSEAKPILVAEDDPRERIKSYMDAFEDIDDTDDDLV